MSASALARFHPLFFHSTQTSQQAHDSIDHIEVSRERPPIIPPQKLKLNTQKERIDALVILASCNATESTRPEITGKKVFAAEVQQWLVGELTASDRRNIYTEPDPLPGQVVYVVAAHFKRKPGEMLRRVQAQDAAAGNAA